MKTLVVIPARGGSKGVPGKNTKLLAGKPLLHYTIEAALNVFDNNEIILSTDDEGIKLCAEQAGLFVPFLRPSALATDTAGTYEVLLHSLDHVECNGYFPDVMILLQPTSPFRTSHHIREALANYNATLDMVVSVKETSSNPYYSLFEEDVNGFLQKSKKGNFTRRQDCPKVWEYTGAIYIINVESLKKSPLHRFTKIKKYEMDAVSSHDIDTLLDWKLAEILANEK